LGAKGDGTTDDTEKINAMFDRLEGGETVYFPAGTYRISEKGTWYDANRHYAISVQNKNNIKIVLSPGAKIKCDKVIGTTQCGIFFFWSCNNIEITGGIIDGGGEHYTFTVPVASGINGIETRDCNNVYIHDMIIHNCYGDGIFISPFYTSNGGTGEQLKGVVVDNCQVYHCARNGISLEGAKDGVIRNCLIYDVKGQEPRSGIDLECEYAPDSGRVLNNNTLIDNCIIYDCDEAINVSTGTQDTVISNCNFYSRTINQADKEQVGDLKVINTKCGMLGLVRNCYVENCEIEYIVSASQTEGSAKGYFKNCTINGVKNSQAAIISISSNGDKLLFDSCVFLDKNPEFSGSTKFVHKTREDIIAPYELTFNKCNFYVWDNLMFFEEGSNSTKKIELLSCNFIYKTIQPIRPIVYVKMNFFKMIDCVIHCEDMLQGVSTDFGATHGIISVRQTDENSVHWIIGNKIINNGLLKTFVTFKNDMSSGTTYLFNNFSNVEKINDNKPTLGTLNSYGNVSQNTVSEIQEISALVGGA
jgi:hypothetical protein